MQQHRLWTRVDFEPSTLQQSNRCLSQEFQANLLWSEQAVMLAGDSRQSSRQAGPVKGTHEAEKLSCWEGRCALAGTRSPCCLMF